MREPDLASTATNIAAAALKEARFANGSCPEAVVRTHSDPGGRGERVSSPARSYSVEHALALALDQDIEQMAGLLQVIDTVLIPPAGNVLYDTSLYVGDMVCQHVLNWLDRKFAVVVATFLDIEGAHAAFILLPVCHEPQFWHWSR